jgi:protein pelota
LGRLIRNSAELNQLTGVAAILTFPLDVEVVEEEEREAKQEQQEREAQEGGNLNGTRA